MKAGVEGYVNLGTFASFVLLDLCQNCLTFTLVTVHETLCISELLFKILLELKVLELWVSLLTSCMKIITKFFTFEISSCNSI